MQLRSLGARFVIWGSWVQALYLPTYWICSQLSQVQILYCALSLANWPDTCQLRFKKILFSCVVCSQFACIGPEKPHWGSGQLSKYTYIDLIVVFFNGLIIK